MAMMDIWLPATNRSTKTTKTNTEMEPDRTDPAGRTTDNNRPLEANRILNRSFYSIFLDNYFIEKMFHFVIMKIQSMNKSMRQQN